jgi:LPXTG-motif cell wall-anchored protein
MDRANFPETGSTGSTMARYVGIAVVVLSVAGLVAGLIFVQG